MKQSSNKSWKNYITTHASRMRRAKLNYDPASYANAVGNKTAVIKDIAKFYLLEEILRWLNYVSECDQKQDKQLREVYSVKPRIAEKCNALISLYDAVIDIASKLISQGDKISSSIPERALIKAVKRNNLIKLYRLGREMACALAAKANIYGDEMEELFKKIDTAFDAVNTIIFK